MMKYLYEYPNYYPRNCHDNAQDSEPTPYFRVMVSETSGTIFIVTKQYTRTYGHTAKPGSRTRKATRWVGCTLDEHGHRTNRDWDKRSVKTTYPITAYKKSFK